MKCNTISNRYCDKTQHDKIRGKKRSKETQGGEGVGAQQVSRKENSGQTTKAISGSTKKPGISRIEGMLKINK